MRFIKLAVITGIIVCTVVATQYAIYQNIGEKLALNTENEKLVRFLKVYAASDKAGPLELVRQGRPNDGGYVAPLKALQTADVLLGYGIANDNSFEEDFARTYHKPAYGFDCGIDKIESTAPLFTFVNECIGNDQFLYDQKKSSGKISSFTQQLETLDLKNKKVFIKMDIEGAEYEAFDNILANSTNVTGIVFEMHFKDKPSTMKAVKLLSDLSKNFVLLHVHGNNYRKHTISTSNAIGAIPSVLELTYINKNLTTHYSVAENQSHPLKIDMPNKANRPDSQFEVLAS